MIVTSCFIVPAPCLVLCPLLISISLFTSSTWLFPLPSSLLCCHCWFSSCCVQSVKVYSLAYPAGLSSAVLCSGNKAVYFEVTHCLWSSALRSSMLPTTAVMTQTTVRTRSLSQRHCRLMPSPGQWLQTF